MTLIDQIMWDREVDDAVAKCRRIARVPDYEAALLVADELAELLDRPDQVDGTTGRYHYNFERVDVLLAAWDAATKGDQHD